MNMHIKDLNLERRSLCIRGAKGGNDRVVPLPASLLPELTQQMQHETGQPEIAAGVVRVVGSLTEDREGSKELRSGCGG